MWQKKTMMPLVGGLCLTVDFDQMWPKMCPSLEDFVTQRTLTKCGPKCAPHRRTLSRSGLWPNVAQNEPLIGRLCHAADFNQMWPKMCPSLEDFVMQRTLTNCGPKCAPRRRTFSRSKLQPNVVQTCAFQQVTLFCYGVQPHMDRQCTHHRKRPVPSKQILIVDQRGNKPPYPITMPCDQYAKRYPYQQASTKKWRVSYPSCNKWQMTRITHNHHQCSIVLDERGKHSYSIYLD